MIEDYPDGHPKGKEISELKDQIDESFKRYKEVMEKARLQYKIADGAYREMGKGLNEAQKILEEVAPKFEELKDLVITPLI